LIAIPVLALARPSLLLGEGETASTQDGQASSSEPKAPALLLLQADIASDDSITKAEALAFGEALRGDMRRALADEGFAIVDEKEGAPIQPMVPVEIGRAAMEAGAAWAALPRLSIEASRISYSAEVYEAGEDASLAAAASFSTYAGVRALPLMEESVRGAAARAAACRDALLASAGTALGRPIQYRITLVSGDEGATASIDDGEKARKLGTIENGRLVLPYLALQPGTRICILLSQTGKRSETIAAVLGEKAQTIEAPPLQRMVGQALSLDTGPGRLLGLGLGYRIFMRPDWLFLFADGRAYEGSDFGIGSLPVFHGELWEGAGAYLVLPPGSLIRVGICAGTGFIISTLTGGTKIWFTDMALSPLELFAECRVTGPISARLSVRSAYSLGLGSGAIERGWMGGLVPLLFSAGLAWGF
jgi:hypothetical protein